LGKARERAKRINCVNSLKQIGGAVYSYSSDFNSYLPAGSTTASSWTYWYSIHSERLVPEYISEDLAHWGCPTRPFDPDINNDGVGAYAMNRCLSGSSDAAYPCHKIVSVSNTSEKILVSDSPDYQWGYAIDDSGWIGRLGNCHDSGFNALFVDSHVEYFDSIFRGQIIIESSPYPLRSKYIKF
jgi:prepilin-type processing-associated H-X9-DG protein